MHEYIQNSATRFNSCKFTRNSGATRLRTALADRGCVRNGSTRSWKRAALRGPQRLREGRYRAFVDFARRSASGALAACSPQHRAKSSQVCRRLRVLLSLRLPVPLLAASAPLVMPYLSYVLVIAPFVATSVLPISHLTVRPSAAVGVATTCVLSAMHSCGPAVLPLPPVQLQRQCRCRCPWRCRAEILLLLGRPRPASTLGIAVVICR